MLSGLLALWIYMIMCEKDSEGGSREGCVRWGMEVGGLGWVVERQALY